MLLNNSPTPSWIISDKQVPNQIGFKIETDLESNYGEYNIKIKATFGTSPLQTVDDTLVIKVVVMRVGISTPIINPISYIVKDQEQTTQVDLFKFYSMPNATDYWGDQPSFMYTIKDKNEGALPDPFYVKWETNGSTKSGSIKIYTDNNDEYLKEKSVDT